MQYWEEEIQKISSQIEKMLPGGGLDTGDRLGDIFRLLLQGKVWEVLRILFHDMKGMIMNEAGGMVQLVVLLLGIGLIAALLFHFTELFENRQIADIGFYFVYLFLVLILIGIFEVIMETGETLVEHILLFLKLFMPLYFMAVGAASGVTTALLGYQLVLLLIFGVEMIFAGVLMPMVKVYLFLVLMNGLWMEERLHMLLELLKRCIGYLLKLLIAVITGVNVVQSLITPVIDSVQLTALQKSIAAIPGIGTLGSSVAEMMAGSAILIKNSVGVMAVLLLFLICAVPVVKIWLLSMTLKLGAALCNIVSDRRITSCMDQVGEGGLLMFRTVAAACGLFFITIAIASISTNRGF